VSEVDLTNPIFHDEDKAREHLEATRWPDGPFCPHCGEAQNIHRLQGKSNRPGLFQCNSCLDTFSVMLGSVMERSHIPLTKWVLAFHLTAASKKGMSAKQIQRMLGVTYKSAWFLMHRIREAMAPAKTAGPIGGRGKVVESDETFVGGKKKNVHRGKPEPKKHAVHALVERGGEVRASHVPDVSAKTLRKAIAKHVDPKSAMNTDDALAYYHMSKEFAAHGVVNHSRGEYVSKDGTVHIQSAEAFFAILKRGVMGSFHSVSEQHLQRYVHEFAFRWNTRSALGIEDAERARLMVKAAVGKRLTYQQPDRKEA
jgi:transposase-like protein